MSNLSVPLDNAMEFISITEISPLISHAQVKVCYVGQDPNRNGTVITKEVATEMGKKLPGSPVVGYYNEEIKDFEGHEKELVIKDGKLKLEELTKPYGFVPTDAKVWFQKFLDNGVEHEYLMTECYIWTGAYPESQRVISQGNNQSMEINKESQEGFWTNDNKTGKRIFIYNEALIEKLCILGQIVEPCFEGAGFAQHFSLENSEEFQNFKTTMFSMLTELQDTLNKGGFQETMEDKKDIQQEFEKKEEVTPKEEIKKEEETPKEEQEKEDKKKYNLEEVTEYKELQEQYNTLQSNFTTLQQEKTSMEAELAELKEFKLKAERESKKNMLDSFYMLSDEDKKEVAENIDTYSLEDIESKLSVICVRNKLNLSEENHEHNDSNKNPSGMFSLEQTLTDEDNAPDWIKAVRSISKNI